MPFFLKLKRIDGNYSHFRRSLEIADALIRFGFEDLAEIMLPEKLRTVSWFHPFKRRKVYIAPEKRPKRVRLLLQTLGPTFVKLGQVLASRPDVLPQEYVAELVKLQDRVPGVPWEKVRRILMSEYGKEPEEVFASIEHTPFAAASMGQAHMATLMDGTPAVVKVRRPGIEEKVRVDLEIMYFLASHLEQVYPDLAIYRPAAAVEEFAHTVMRELDFTIEAGNAARFHVIAQKQEGIYSPKVFPQFSTRQLLVEEAIRGDSVKSVLADRELQKKYDLQSVARHGVHSMINQIFVHGYFHADPHAGNLILMEGNRLCFIDFGMMGRVTAEEKTTFIRLIQSVLQNDTPKLVHEALKLVVPLDGKPDMRMLERDLGDLVDSNLYLPLGKMSLAKILEELMHILSEYRLALLPNLYVLFKALATAEHLAKKFDPDLPVMEILTEAMWQANMPRLQLRKRAAMLYEELDSTSRLLYRLPRIAETLFSKIEHDDFRMHIEYQGMDSLRSDLTGSIHHLACAVVLASMIVGSSLVVLSGIPPLWKGVPLLGVTGFCVSGLLGAGLLAAGKKRREVKRRKKRRRF